MDIEEEARDIIRIWHSLEGSTKWELANIWLDKEKHELRVMEAEVVARYIRENAKKY